MGFVLWRLVWWMQCACKVLNSLPFLLPPADPSHARYHLLMQQAPKLIRAGSDAVSTCTCVAASIRLGLDLEIRFGMRVELALANSATVLSSLLVSQPG